MCAAVKNVQLTVLIQSLSNSDDKGKAAGTFSAKFSLVLLISFHSTNKVTTTYYFIKRHTPHAPCKM